MESEFEVTIDIDIEYDVGSPPDGLLDPWAIAEPDAARFTGRWMSTQDGQSEGVLTTGTSALYPPFTDVLRRHVFAVIQFATLGTSTLTWNAETVLLGRMFITTDDGWDAAGVAVTNLGEGSWFSCEGELDEDFGKWREGVDPVIDPL